MAGLIQQQMGGAPQGPGGDSPMQAPEEEMMMAEAGEEVVEDEEQAEDNPMFQQALTYAYEALYAQEAAKDVAKQLKSAPSLADGMSDVAYNITSIIDERTDGQVPDEMLVPLAMNVLEEVGEIADAAGMDPQPEDVATAFKTMILRYLGEQGVDTTQLQQAMDQVNPSEFRKAAELV
jgi:hypothetical protein